MTVFKQVSSVPIRVSLLSARSQLMRCLRKESLSVAHTAAEVTASATGEMAAASAATGESHSTAAAREVGGVAAAERMHASAGEVCGVTTDKISSAAAHMWRTRESAIEMRRA